MADPLIDKAIEDLFFLNKGEDLFYHIGTFNCGGRSEMVYCYQDLFLIQDLFSQFFQVR